jgi:hypothetical protein
MFEIEVNQPQRPHYALHFIDGWLTLLDGKI